MTQPRPETCVLAAQVMDKEHIQQQNYAQQVAQEIHVLKSLDHPSVSRLFAQFEDAKNIYAVLEYCPQGLPLQNGGGERGGGLGKCTDTSNGPKCWGSMSPQPGSRAVGEGQSP